jgi:hypothetical protein
MVADPPYGVGYDPSWRARRNLSSGRLAQGKVLNDDRADWPEAYALFPGDVAYVWHGALHGDVVAARRHPLSSLHERPLQLSRSELSGAVRLSVGDARALGEAALARIGYGEDDARIITDQLIDHSHCGYQFAGLPPGRQANRAHSRGKPTFERRCGRETDSLLEGDGFELSVPGRETFKLSWETGLLSRKRSGSVGEPKVRIHLPPAASQERTVARRGLCTRHI